jgi:hypothetical protein
MRTLDTLSAAAMRRRILADTEEVTGSNPVSPTSTIPGQMQFQHIASDVCARYVRERHQRDCSSASSGRCDNDHHPPATTTQLVQPWGCSLERYVIRQEQAAVNGWLGRADCRYSRTLRRLPLVGPLSRRYGVAVNGYTYTGRTSRLLARQEEVAGGGLGPISSCG